MKKSFTLVEVIVFIAIVAIFYIVAASVVTVSLRNMTVNEHKISATHYAKQLEEWLRAQREANWDTFLSRASTSGVRYCFNTAIISGWPASGSCSSPGLNPPIFNREVVLTSSNCGVGFCTQVGVNITVRWNDFNSSLTVPVMTRFTVLE